VIEANSPIGWLIAFGVLAFLAYFIFGMSRNRYLNPHPRQELRQDPTLQRRMTDLTRCPECGSTNVKFDTMKMMTPPIMITCDDCDHEWIYTPGQL